MPQKFSSKIILFIVVLGLFFTSFKCYGEEKEPQTAFEKFNAIIKELDVVDKDIIKEQDKINKIIPELEEATLVYNIQMDISKKHIKYMYENTYSSFVLDALSTKDLGILNSRIQNFYTISRYDNTTIVELRRAKKKVENKKKEIEKLQKKLNKHKNELEELKIKAQEEIDKEVEEKRQEMAAMLNNYGVSNESAGDNTNTSYVSNSCLLYVPSETEIKFLAAILEAEAGPKSYIANLAVGTVICNRVNSPDFPNTIYDVITQPGQFSTINHATRILNDGVSKNSLKAAKACVEGQKVDSIANCLYFWSEWYAYSHGRSGVNIGGNVFF